MGEEAIAVTINGVERRLLVRDQQTLLDLLRDGAGLTGTNEGCRVGECGSCTVLLNGARVPACLVLARRVAGAEVTTIESLAGSDLHPLQDAFVRHGALQCGFCTPGMIISALAILQEEPDRPLTAETVRSALTGNLCRCTGYAKIVAAILEVANE